MKALIKTQKAKGLWLEDVRKPDYGVDEVLIKVHKTGICGTDIHIYDWDDWASYTVKPPCIIGHEFVGSVEKVGSNVKEVAVGDLVTAEGHMVCGHCRNCLAGRRHLCPNTVGLGIHRDGAFAEYVAIPATNIWQCSPDIPEEIFAIYDPLGNAVHTALSFDVLGEDILITGAGPIGIMAVAIARHAGARHIVVSDINPLRLELAEQMGASLTVNVAEGKGGIENAKKTLGMREGFDVGLEMSGNAEALKQMIAHMVHGGHIAMLGIQAQDTAIDWDALVFKGLTMKGIYGRKMYETWYTLTSMLQSGMDMTPVITHQFPYTEFEQAFEVIKSGESAKVILQW